jgi:hypothetical protein
MDTLEILAYGGIILASYVAGWASKRYHHETDSDVARARAAGRREGAEAGRQRGIDALAESLTDVCEEKGIVHIGKDESTGRDKGYPLRELLEEAQTEIHGH